jgi:hypothetical protein
VAIVGLLATVVSAWLGGYWANRSVERELESQRSAQIQDQRREVYLGYVEATTKICDAITTGDQAQIDKAAVEVLNHQTRVLLIAGSRLRETVRELTEELVFAEDPSTHPCSNAQNYVEFRDAFVEAAASDLPQG